MQFIWSLQPKHRVYYAPAVYKIISARNIFSEQIIAFELQLSLFVFGSSESWYFLRPFVYDWIYFKSHHFIKVLELKYIFDLNSANIFPEKRDSITNLSYAIIFEHKKQKKNIYNRRQS